MRFRPNSRPVDVTRLRARLGKMSDLQLMEFGKAARSRLKKKNQKANSALQLKEAQAEWQRRHPTKVRATRSEFERHKSDAMLSYVLRRTVGVVNEVRIEGKTPDERPADQEVPGTGCPILWSRKRLILTAKHVIGTANVKDIRITAFAQTALVFKEPEKITLADTEAGEPLPAGSSILHCEWEDLAAIVLPDGSFSQCDFVDIQAGWIDPSKGDPVHCCGFPSDHNVVVGRKMICQREEIGLGLYPTVFSAEVMGQPSKHEQKFHITDFNRNHHYLIPYASSGSKHPRGISGAAVWWESDQEMLVWRPEFKFAGICVSTYRRGRVVQVIKASVVLRFLREVFS